MTEDEYRKLSGHILIFSPPLEDLVPPLVNFHLGPKGREKIGSRRAPKNFRGYPVKQYLVPPCKFPKNNKGGLNTTVSGKKYRESVLLVSTHSNFSGCAAIWRGLGGTYQASFGVETSCVTPRILQHGVGPRGDHGLRACGFACVRFRCEDKSRDEFIR